MSALSYKAFRDSAPAFGPRLIRIVVASFIIVLASCAAPGSTKASNLPALDAYRKSIGAGSISVAYAIGNGEPVTFVVGDAGYGPATKATFYGAGSITKEFTSALVLRLAQEGKLKLSDSLAKFVPEARTHFPQVSLTELLDHTSGIPNYLSKTGCGGCDAWHWRHASLEMLQRKAEFAPGTRFSYSNTDYTLLGLVVEAASGRDYEDVLRSQLLSDRDLQEVSYGPPSHDVAQPVHDAINPQSTTWPTSITGPAGALYATPALLVRWMQQLFVQRKVLDQYYLDQMLCSCAKAFSIDDAGLGIFIAKSKNGTVTYYHFGDVLGYSALAMYFPRDQTSIAVMINDSQIQGPLRVIAYGLHRQLMERSSPR